jgi:hypothetical protein
VSHKEANETPDPESIKPLLIYMSLALIGWEHVEDELYLLFRKLLNYPSDSICSILYHSPPSFESRRVLLDRIIEACIMPKEARIDWKKISKRLVKASEHRGQPAHFGLGFEIEFPGQTPPLNYRFINPHLRPSLKNRLKSSQGRGYENKDNRISASKITEYIEEFSKLKSDIESFRSVLIVAQLPRSKRPRSEIAPRPLSKLAPLLFPLGKTREGSPPPDE